MVIQHAAFVDNWNQIELIENAKTIILGSFNPNQPGNNTDFYYGRSANYFWPTIANLEGRNPNFYFNNLIAKHEAICKYKFCFFDVVESIDVTSVNEIIERNFVDEKIFTEFSDQILFTTNTNYLNHPVRVIRNYNLDVLNVIANKRIVQTMGNNRILINGHTSPIEHNANPIGFQAYINLIVQNCQFFQPVSYSPSAHAVRTGGIDYQLNLSNWIYGNILNV
jgi:hypothetical protein